MKFKSPTELLLIGFFFLTALPHCNDDCPTPSNSGPIPYFKASFEPSENTPASWLEYPFPAEHRTTAGGQPRFADFPNPKGVGLLDDYIDLLEQETTGFSPTSGIYIRFDSELDTTTLPQYSSESRSINSALQLIDITEGSPEYGELRPLRWEYWDQSSQYIASHTLAVAPVWGLPLRENTRYALMITDQLKGINGSPAQSPALLQHLLSSDVPQSCVDGGNDPSAVEALKEQFAPLKTILESRSIEPTKIVAATVFTTGDTSSQLKTIYDQVQAAPAPTLLSEWRYFDEAETEDAEPGEENNSTSSSDATPYQERTFKWRPSPIALVDYYVFEGSYESPNYQHGTVPYNTGGGFEFENGQALIARTEELRTVITVPKAPPSSGRCYPIVEYAHGTGGSAYSMVENGSAGRLAGRGLAGISIDQPLHGPRGQGKNFDVQLASFNFTNARAARATFRQSAIDTFSLTRMLKNGIKIPSSVSPTGEEICFLKQSIGFFGHSQGGLSGAIAMAYENDIQSWVLSGTGGGLTITILERKDIANFQELMALVLQIDSDDILSELHPTMMIVQSAVDVADPITYAPHWIAQGTHSTKQNVLLTSGERDQQTPHRTAAALAVAARVPIVQPQEIDIPNYALLGMDPISAPVTGNIDAAYTAGFLQWPSTASPAKSHVNHFLVFNSPEAIHASMYFLQTNTTREYPIIERDTDANVR